MEHATRMGECHRIANALEGTQTAGPSAFAFDEVIKALAFYKFHCVEDAAIGKRSRVMNRNNAGMLERGENVRLTKKASLRGLQKNQKHPEFLQQRGGRASHLPQDKPCPCLRCRLAR